jgi:hypothetical protein
MVDEWVDYKLHWVSRWHIDGLENSIDVIWYVFPFAIFQMPKAAFCLLVFHQPHGTAILAGVLTGAIAVKTNGQQDCAIRVGVDVAKPGHIPVVIIRQ